MYRWRPIETAPQDHEEFIPIIGYEPDSRCGRIFVCFAAPDDWPGPRFADENRTRYPTHWMPLPEPPKEKSR